MKIYKNKKGQTVIDGDNITTITLTGNVGSVRDWLAKRIFPNESDDFIHNVVVANFTFIGPNPKNIHFRNVNERNPIVRFGLKPMKGPENEYPKIQDGCIDLSQDSDFVIL